MPKKINAKAMKTGRYGSNAMRLPIHAPLKPNPTKSSGPTQRADALSAAMVPAMSELFAFIMAIVQY